MCSSFPGFDFEDLMTIMRVDINFSSSSGKIPTCFMKTIPWQMLSASLLLSSSTNHLGIKPQIKPIIDFSTPPHEQLNIVKNHTIRLAGFTFIITVCMHTQPCPATPGFSSKCAFSHTVVTTLYFHFYSHTSALKRYSYLMPH